MCYVATRTGLAIALVSLGLGFTAASVHASFMNCMTATTSTDLVVAGCDNWRIGQPPLAAGALGGPNWSIRFSEPAQGMLGTLLIDVQHLKSPDDLPQGQKHIDPNPKNAQQINAGVFGETTRGSGVVVIPHDAHFDVYDYIVNPNLQKPPTPRTSGVAVAAGHDKQRGEFRWSYDPEGVPGRLQVIQSGPLGDTRVQLPNGADKPKGEADSGKLDAGSTDYRIQYSPRRSAVTDTTLAFVTGSASELSEGDLSLLTDFFLGDGRFFVPTLFDSKDLQDLFIAVDLTQWLNFPTYVNNGDEFDIVNGVSDALPGFLVSTSPISFDPAVGFKTDNAATLRVIAQGTIDGSVAVPQPMTLALIAGGMIGLGLLGRRRATHRLWPRKSTIGPAIACPLVSFQTQR